jgi:anti-sigma regulatory factor (Ser/Thr protein kinase)
LKYAATGELVARGFDAPGRGAGIEIVARDEGPPIVDFSRALRDGWTDCGPVDPATLLQRRGIGAGLGAVARLTDELGYERGVREKAIVAIRYLKRPRRR